jgi:hypothetical protein
MAKDLKSESDEVINPNEIEYSDQQMIGITKHLTQLLDSELNAQDHTPVSDHSHQLENSQDSIIDLSVSTH